MLTKYDEMTCHQTVSTFDFPLESDRAWTEKLWMNIHDTTGKFALAAGFGIYPNRNVMDGFACFGLEGKSQTNLRLSRQLRPNRDLVSIGPLSYDIKEPYRRIGLALTESDQDLKFDLEFLGRFHPALETPHQFQRDFGRVSVNTKRYAQIGRARGWIEYQGTRYDLDENNTYAQRDHSWGIRLGVGAPEQGVQSSDVAAFVGMMINWFTFQFSDWAVSCYLIEDDSGRVRFLSGRMVRDIDGPDEGLRVTAVEHDYQFHPNTALTKAGSLTLTFEDGSTRSISVAPFNIMYLRGGGYLGYRRFNHGMWMGPIHSEGETWDLTDPKIAAEAHGLDDTICRVECDGQTGYGILENLILPPFAKYGFPPMDPRRS